METRKWLRLLVLPACLACGCSGNSNTPVAPTPSPTPIPTPTPTPPPIVPRIAFLVGAGDIADCRVEGDRGSHAEATAKLIDSMTDASVFTLGDNAYFDGTLADFNNCYKPRWGRHLSRTYPSPGNHDGYDSGLNGSSYFDYFAGQPTGDRFDGFYSYTLGNWHIIALNSNIAVGPGSPQYTWLARDLVENSQSAAKCALAYWHHPLFTSGPSAGSNQLMRPIWNLLFDRGVDVVVNGHDHLYERFFPQTPDALRSANAGITEYVVGTGGAPLYEFGPTAPNSAAKFNRSYGVVRFTLRDVGWDSVFVEAGTGLNLDPSINNLCH